MNEQIERLIEAGKKQIEDEQKAREEEKQREVAQNLDLWAKAYQELLEVVPQAIREYVNWIKPAETREQYPPVFNQKSFAVLVEIPSLAPIRMNVATVQGKFSATDPVDRTGAKIYKYQIPSIDATFDRKEFYWNFDLVHSSEVDLEVALFRAAMIAEEKARRENE